MGYVIPKPHFSSCEGINTIIVAVLTGGRGHPCDLSRKAPPGEVVTGARGPTGRCRSTMTALTGVAASFKQTIAQATQNS